VIGILFAAAFTLSSSAFTNGGNIPSKFTCDAGQTNPSPALEAIARERGWRILNLFE